MSEPKIVTSYKVSIESHHISKARDDLEIHLAVIRVVGSSKEAVYSLRPARVVDLIEKLAGQVGLVMVEGKYGRLGEDLDTKYT